MLIWTVNHLSINSSKQYSSKKIQGLQPCRRTMITTRLDFEPLELVALEVVVCGSSPLVLRAQLLG
jgi:hypothetical protein